MSLVPQDHKSRAIEEYESALCRGDAGKHSAHEFEVANLPVFYTAVELSGVTTPSHLRQGARVCQLMISGTGSKTQQTGWVWLLIK